MISVSGSSEDDVAATSQFLVDEVNQELHPRQGHLHDGDQRDEVTVAVVSETTTPTKDFGNRTRIRIAIVAIGAIIAVTMAIVADTILGRRAARRAEPGNEDPELADPDSDEGPDLEPDEVPADSDEGPDADTDEDDDPDTAEGPDAETDVDPDTETDDDPDTADDGGTPTRVGLSGTTRSGSVKSTRPPAGTSRRRGGSRR